MSTATPFTKLVKPIGTEPFARSILNENNDKIDKSFIALTLCAIAYGEITKGPLIVNANDDPVSQSISGLNGLTGNMTWSFTETTITETLSITAPIAFSVVKTINLTNLSEVYTVS